MDGLMEEDGAETILFLFFPLRFPHCLRKLLLVIPGKGRGVCFFSNGWIWLFCLLGFARIRTWMVGKGREGYERVSCTIIGWPFHILIINFITANRESFIRVLCQHHIVVAVLRSRFRFSTAFLAFSLACLTSC